MQLARGFFLTPEKRFKRKFLEIVITFQLEHRFTKQKIFEMYANQVPLGQRGSFSINGFGEAAQAYFGKDVRQLTLPECALLAGLIQSPSRLNPYRHVERATTRRNLVLDSMVETGAITKEQAEEAKASPLNVIPGAVDAGEAPYFVDLVREQLAQRLGPDDYNQQGLQDLHLARSAAAEFSHRCCRGGHEACRRAGGEAARAAGEGGRRFADRLSAGGAGGAESAYGRRCWRWWADATMGRASSTMRCRIGRRDRSSSPLCTRRHSIRAWPDRS